MLEDLTNENDRIRKSVRALIEEARREHDERIVHQTTVATFDRASRQTMLTPWGKSFFRGTQINRKETSKDPSNSPQSVEESWVQSVCDRLIRESECAFEGVDY